MMSSDGPASYSIKTILLAPDFQTGSHLGQHLHINIAYEVLAKAVCPIITVRADSSWSNPSRAL
jgi:hypothetical protein